MAWLRYPLARSATLGSVTSMFVHRSDKDFLSEWSDHLNETTCVHVSARHILAALVIEARQAHAQGNLFQMLTAIDTIAVTLAERDEERLEGRVNEARQEVRLVNEHGEKLEQARRDKQARRVASPEYQRVWAEKVRKWRALHRGDPEPTFDQILDDLDEREDLNAALEQMRETRKVEADLGPEDRPFVSSKEWRKRMRKMMRTERERQTKRLSPAKKRRAA